MLSLSSFRAHCLPLFRIMRDTKMELEIVYKGVVYDMSIKATDKKPALTRSKRKYPEQIRNIDVEACPECMSLMFNNVCMNPKCIHATGTLKSAVESV